MHLIKNGLLGSGLLFSLCSISLAELKLPAFFSDRMVLQQETGANIWGWADAGQEVKVSFSGVNETTQADKEGKWKVQLKALKATKEGAVLTITAGEEKKEINDVVVGEVWIASGQSNMEWVVKKCSSKVEIPTANDDLLRVYVTDNKTAVKPLEDFKGSWLTTKPGNTEKFTAVGYEFAKVLRRELDVPVGVVECAWGGKPVEAFISQEAIEECPEAEVVRKKLDDTIRQWKKKMKRMGKPIAEELPRKMPNMHSAIYNGMIAPIAGYSSRGVIWYQGESNTTGMTHHVYGELLECLIHDWRKRWGSNLSFYYVQLANFHRAVKIENWVIVQDEMRRLLDDEDMKAGHIGMATINDIGTPRNIHPPNKKDVGERLARWALKKDYGKTDVVVSGPLYDSHEVKGSAIELTFKYGEGLKTRDGKALATFEITGSDGVWKTADAKLEGDKVVVSSKEVEKPLKVRYAWNSNPVGANLVNAEGLPASCFVTKSE